LASGGGTGLDGTGHERQRSVSVREPTAEKDRFTGVAPPVPVIVDVRELCS